MEQRLITVFGGSGFVGRYVVQHLARQGYRIRVAVRNPNRALFLKPLGDIGQIQIVQANIRDAGSVARAVAGADAVVNLVGILFETGHQRFQPTQGTAAGALAEAAKAAGVKAFIQMSAIGADERSESRYARSKGLGERLVRRAFPAATIMRPSIIFGPEDGFFNRFALLAKLSPVLPLIGGRTRFQPVYVGDVADALVAALDPRNGAAGHVFELGGPHVYTFRALMELMLKEIGRKRPLIPVPFALAEIEAFFLQMMPTPLLTVDQVTLLKHDNITSPEAPGLEDLGVSATPAEAVLPTYLSRYRPKGQFSRLERA